MTRHRIVLYKTVTGKSPITTQYIIGEDTYNRIMDILHENPNGIKKGVR